MDNISNVDVSPPVPPSPTMVEITATTFFDPEIDGASEDESVVEVRSCCLSGQMEGEERQDEDGTFGYDSDSSPGPMSLSPTARATSHWINHNIPLLHEYAARQVSPPLFNRVNIEFNHPSQFVMGTMQMLANRDKEGEEDPEPTRRTPPQLLEGYVDIDRWAKEYLRTQFGLERLGDSVPELLTIITNNFYEAHMHLMDAIVKNALSNMEIRRGPWLEAGDFGFGFDLHVAQEIPFLVNTHHRVRETLDYLNTAPKPSPAPPAEGVTRYGRRSKPTAGARQAAGLKATDSKEPTRDQPKQIASKASVQQKNATKPVAHAPPPGTDDSDIPVVNAPVKKGRPRKSKPDAKILLTQPTLGDISIDVSNNTRQPLGRTSLTNTAPSGVVGGKTLAHLALIKRQDHIPSSTSRHEERPIDQRPPKIVIKPLTHFTKLSTPRGSPASWNTSTVDTSSGSPPSGVDLTRDTAGVLPTSNTGDQDLFAASTIPNPSNPLPVPSSETSHHARAVRLKRKRDGL